MIFVGFLFKIVNRIYNSFLVFINYVSLVKNSFDICMNYYFCNMNDWCFYVINELFFDCYCLLLCVGRNILMFKYIFLYSFEFISKSY